jgi:hypothetical protein
MPVATRSIHEPYRNCATIAVSTFTVAFLATANYFLGAVREMEAAMIADQPVATCACPRGWCYRRADCRQQNAAPKPAPPVRRSPPLWAVRQAELIKRRDALQQELAEVPDHERRPLQRAIDAIEAALTFLSPK